MNFNLFDSHCHLHGPAYYSDRDAIIAAARADGLGLVTIGTNLRTSAQAVRLAEAHPQNIWASIAVHPGHVHAPHHDAQEQSDPPEEEFFEAENFAALAASASVVAVGETGLDYYRLEDSLGATTEEIKDKQKRNLEAQIVFAQERGLPLICHIRASADQPSDAHEDALEIFRRFNVAHGVMHCFSGTPAHAERYLERGLHISFAGNAAFPPKKGQLENPLAAVCRMVPADRLLVETDAPWLTPPPLRGARNEPANVKLVAAAVAGFRSEDASEISRITAQNAISIFGLAKRHRA
jgi:TatD DNase family protein